MNSNQHSDTTSTPARAPRIDLYGPIHKGIRWALCTLLTRMGSTDFSDPSELRKTIDDLDGLLYVCEGHAAHEERFIHPALERKRPGLSRPIAEAHEGHGEVIADLRALSATVHSAVGDDAKAQGHRLYLRYTALVAELLAHMAEEEEVIQPMLQEAYTPTELLAILGELVASLGPEEKVASLRLMFPAATREERVGLVAMMKGEAPVEVFTAVLQSFRASISAADWEHLERHLLSA